MSDLDDIFKSLQKLGFDVKSKPAPVESFPSGSWLLDRITGISGHPVGRVMELFGSEMSGKTYLSLLAIREAQKLGHICAYIDAEHGFDPLWTKKIGVDLDQKKLIVLKPDYGEQALEAAIQVMPACRVVVIDSTAALVPKAEIEGSVEDQSIGLQARMMSHALRMMVTAAANHKSTIIFINQLREKISHGGMPTWGEQVDTPGGRALKFYCSTRLRVEKKSLIKDGENRILGHDMLIKIVKNKCGNPYGQVTLPFYYGVGINEKEGILALAIEQGVIQQSGRKYDFGTNSWMSFADMSAAIDLEAVKAKLP